MKVLFVVVFLLFSNFAWSQESKVQDSTLVSNLDRVPLFPGGASGWQNFLVRTMNINEAIRELDSAQYVDFGTRQTAILEFTVCEDGKICDIEILNKNKISPAFAKEALRVMKRSPRWKPGQKDNQPVRARFRQSITAILDED